MLSKSRGKINLEEDAVFYGKPVKEWKNTKMLIKLITGKCLDVRTIGTPNADGVFKLRGFVEDMDYCDALNENWIRSIGSVLEYDTSSQLNTYAYYAATDDRFYQNAHYVCVWFR